jgi:predicted dehydrogenase
MKNNGNRSREHAITRRGFMGSAAAAAAFTIIPRHVLGGEGQTPPSEKLNIAAVGFRNQGDRDLKNFKTENIVALCDVDEGVLAGEAKEYPSAKTWTDYREMLDKQKDIDAVTIAVPDHNHAIIAMAAMKAGKHVYCQKPLTHDIAEARALTEAARKYKVATQMGNQGQASEGTRRICELIWAGAIGPVREVHVWTDRPGEHWPQGIAKPTDTPDVPKNLHWDLWLGPAAQRPYHPAYVPYNWRGWWDFGTGALGDMGCHMMDAAFRALKLGAPASVQASSSPNNGESYPLATIVRYEFPARGEMPPVKMVWYDSGLTPPRPDQLEDGRRLNDNGLMFIGDDGVMIDETLIPEKRRKEFKPPDKTLPRSQGHYQEWIDACKGGKPGGSNFDIAGPLTEMVLLGTVALRLELKEPLSRTALRWDPQKMQCPNVPEANSFIRRPYREGWSL